MQRQWTPRVYLIDTGSPPPTAAAFLPLLWEAWSHISSPPPPSSQYCPPPSVITDVILTHHHPDHVGGLVHLVETAHRNQKQRQNQTQTPRRTEVDGNQEEPGVEAGFRIECDQLFDPRLRIWKFPNPVHEKPDDSSGPTSGLPSISKSDSVGSADKNEADYHAHTQAHTTTHYVKDWDNDLQTSLEDLLRRTPGCIEEEAQQIRFLTDRQDLPLSWSVSGGTVGEEESGPATGRTIGANPRTDVKVEAEGGLRVLHTPGHTPDSICLVMRDEEGRKVIFTGDTILG